MADIVIELRRVCRNGLLSLEGCEESNCKTCKAAHEILVLREDIKELEETRRELKEALSKLRVCTIKHKRITDLLRKAIPEEDQVGYGIDGMIESLLARMVRLSSEK